MQNFFESLRLANRKKAIMNYFLLGSAAKSNGDILVPNAYIVKFSLKLSLDDKLVM